MDPIIDFHALHSRRGPRILLARTQLFQLTPEAALVLSMELYQDASTRAASVKLRRNYSRVTMDHLTAALDRLEGICLPCTSRSFQVPSKSPITDSVLDE